jgi:hypothetical protein
MTVCGIAKIFSQRHEGAKNTKKTAGVYSPRYFTRWYLPVVALRLCATIFMR